MGAGLRSANSSSATAQVARSQMGAAFHSANSGSAALVARKPGRGGASLSQ